jgi:hypothetical protein
MDANESEDRRRQEPGGSAEEKRWKYSTSDGFGTATSDHLQLLLDCEEVSTEARIHPVHEERVAVLLEAASAEMEVAVLGNFTPEIAEELAHDLLVNAQAARQEADNGE